MSKGNPYSLLKVSPALHLELASLVSKVGLIPIHMKKTRENFIVAGCLIAAIAVTVVRGAQSTYSDGNNRDLNRGAWGPLNLGDRAKYGVVQFRGNQEFTYDDNIFLTQSGRTNDWASVTSPGISYRLGNFDHNAIEWGYDVDLIRYFSINQEDGQNHLPYFHSKFNFGRTKLIFFDQVQVVEGGSNRGVNEITQRVQKTSNDALISAETQIDDKLAVALQLHHYYYNPVGTLLERWQIDGGPRLYYKAFKQLDLFIEGIGGHVDVTRGAREDFAQGKVGFRGDITSKLSGIFSIGGEHRTSSVPGIGDQETPILLGSLTQAFNPDLFVTLNASRLVDVSIVTAGQSIIRTSTGLTGKYQFGPILDPELQTRKLAFELGYSYENDDYDLSVGGVRQQTDIHSIAPSLEYRIQDFWKIYLAYRYQDLDSNVGAGSYDNHRVSIGTAIYF